jgi:Poly(R)-hydroxyalkanoic acid synthase subunit (PHA_synth_III_E)
MESPFSSTEFRPDELYKVSAERFFELLKSFAAPTPASGGAARDWSQMAGPLATQLEQWLRMSQASGSWFSAPSAAAAAAAPGFTGSQGWPFGPLPLGPAAVQKPETQRIWELAARFAQLQTQLAAHWSEIARAAAQRFVARAGVPSATPSLEQTLKLYELWVASAEEAYAATARGEEFSRLQSELANVSAAILVEQRRHAESLARAFGLPTRNEVDVLYAHLKDLTRQLAAVAAGPKAPRVQRAGARAKTKKGARAKGAASKPRGRA